MSHLVCNSCLPLCPRYRFAKSANNFSTCCKQCRIEQVRHFRTRESKGSNELSSIENEGQERICLTTGSDPANLYVVGVEVPDVPTLTWS